MDKKKRETIDTESIWRNFSNLLRRFILKRVQNKDDAEDILQEVFIKIHLNIVQLKEKDKLKAWLYQIARNAVIDYYRAKSPMRELSPLPELSQKEPKEDSDISSEFSPCIRLLIDHLPEKYRQVIILHELEGLTQKKIAERLGLSLPGAKSRVQRGRKKLKELLLDCCDFEFDRLGNILDYHPKGKHPECCIREEKK